MSKGVSFYRCGIGALFGPGTNQKGVADMEDRETWASEAFVELSDTLIDDFNLVKFTRVLVNRCVELLSPAEVGLVLIGAMGELDVVASSTERMRTLELMEIEVHDAPYRVCLDDGRPLLNQHLLAVESRWPHYAASARAAGFATVHALPLRLRGDIIGVMDICSEEGVDISRPDADLAQALADTATIGILQERHISRGNELADQLQQALNSRLVVEQAKGMVAEGRNVDLDAAFAMLLRHARAGRFPLRDVARGIVQRTMSLADLHAVEPSHVERRSAGPRPSSPPGPT
jgi:hypothetical protein